jgi:hypothetical protein
MIPGLTDTGYKAPDGTPLYKECVGPGMALPPVYPTPVATVPVPSPLPATTRVGTPPASSALPSVDPLAVAPPDSSSWPTATSACLGLTFRYPTDLTTYEPLTVEGYQQEGGESYGTADRHFVIELHMVYSTADELGLVRGSQLASGEYRVLSDAPADVGGAPGVVTYGTEPNGEFATEVSIGYTVSPRANWYLQVIGFFAAPYDTAQFATFNALVSSVSFAR